VSVPGPSPSSMQKDVKRGYKYFFQLGLIEVDYETGCWIWLGAQDPTDGYGKINRKNGDGKWSNARAQNYFYQLYRGPLPKGVDVAHRCHRRLCVKLKHLERKSHTMNMREMFAYTLGEAERSEVRRLMLEGFDYTYIADKLMAPRPLIMKALKSLDWRQDELF
jgi:hypothetical protein